MEETKDGGFKNLKPQGLFSKIAGEGVRYDLDHWIGDGRLRLKEREKERGELPEQELGGEFVASIDWLLTGAIGQST